MLKLIKKIIAFIMALFVPASAAGSIMPDVDRAAASATVYEYGLLYYTVDANDEITITSVKNTGENLGDVTIPAEIDGKSVKYFKCEGVYDRTDIESLTFPYNCDLLDLGLEFSDWGYGIIIIPKINCQKYSLAHKAAYSNSLNFELTDDDGSESYVGLNWYIDDDGEAHITGIRVRWYCRQAMYDDPEDPLNIPSELEGCPVVSVAGMYGSEDAHGYGIISLKKVTLPSSVKYIWHLGFFGLRTLESINLDNGVEDIGESAFEDCFGLQSIILGPNVKRVGRIAFCGCIGLNDITVLNRDTVLEEYCFDTYNSSTTLYCYENSTAHDYAVEKGMNFVLIDESSLMPAAGSSANIGANGLVRGVPLGLSTADLLSLLSVDGSATIQITDNSGNIGTGTRIDLINSTYGNVESSYYLVFSGDVDGDGVIDNSDFLNARGVLAGNTEFENPAQFAAADLNGDGYFSICDYTLLKSVLAGANTLNSATGELTPSV